LIDDSLANGYLFDLIIIDHQMASEDGANVAVDIASTYPDYSAAIILHTAAQDSIYTELSRNHALDTVIRKPLRRGFLYQQLAILSGQSRPEEGTLRESGHEQTLSRLRERKVLLVDDNTVNRMVARAMLNKVGITPDTAVNGLNAVNLYKQHHYDLILMDLQMPVMNGFDATAAIREHERQAAHNASYIIALTANALEGSRERCLDAGMDNYLAKPFTMAELLDAISRPVLTTTTAPSQSPTTAPSQHPTTAQQEGGGRSDHHPVVSEAVFEQLQSLFGADGHAMALSSFCIDSSSKIMKLRESDGSSDEAGTVQHRIIHSLKGSSGNLGMARLHHHYLALERQLKEGGGLLSGAEIDELEVLQRLSCSEYEKKLKKSA
ncbi:MAG: response regulator, partial [Chromatiales bacterium]|nr:response regulator [Chromatiales bacterium]